VKKLNSPLSMTAPLISPEAVRQATQLLEAIISDRRLLIDLSEADRIALLRAAGKVAQPERDVRARMNKAVRTSRRQAKRAQDRHTRAATEIRTLRQAPVYAPSLLRQLGPVGDSGRRLQKPRACYVCKTEYQSLHFYYDSMCHTCAELNYAKRFQRAKLDGQVALITGARVKIGFQASLMLLRSGARVIATTRFPHDAAQRYAQEPDFAVWGHRLQLYGLDLRHAPSVELFAQQMVRTHERLDILINNAAQTVRRPPGFYAHLLATERLAPEALPTVCGPLLEGHRAFLRALGSNGVDAHSADALAVSWRSSDAALGIHSSAQLSQLPYAFESRQPERAVFPEGRLDADLQQVDLRRVNSWRLTLAEVPMAEMLEVHLVNAVAPFILCSQLKPLMLRDRLVPGHVVNVSAMEGSFSRGTKTDKHPHTNMAKAALNMLTLTSAPDYAKSGIYMNAVDTGWVTDEDPALHAQRKAEELDFQPPLDIVDGAARVVDPVFQAVSTGELVWGKFFKDYAPTAW
jgi:NAD(P)-dependent dehydrogenase (short-subunit alcohol dehydrogenase family)